MRSFILSFFCSLLSLAVAEPILSPAILHEKRDHVPVGWSHSHKLHATAVLPLRFGLSQPNVDAIDEYLNNVADPESPNYGKHWTAGLVAATFAPTDNTIQTVKNWLLDGGISGERIRLTKTKGWIELNATVQEAEKLLNAEYHVYKHAGGKEHVGMWTAISQYSGSD